MALHCVGQRGSNLTMRHGSKQDVTVTSKLHWLSLPQPSFAVQATLVVPTSKKGGASQVAGTSSPQLSEADRGRATIWTGTLQAIGSAARTWFPGQGSTGALPFSRFTVRVTEAQRWPATAVTVSSFLQGRRSMLKAKGGL